MPRFRTVASEVNTVHRLVNASPITKADLITHIITADSGSKKWKYLRTHLRTMTTAEIEAFIQINDSYFATKIAKDFLSENGCPMLLKEQISIDFNAATARLYTYTPPQHLTITINKGKYLGEPLRDFVLDAIKDYAITQGKVFIVLSKHGITIDEAEAFTMPYPKGVTAQGTGTATVRAEALWRMLVRTPQKPSWIPGYSARFMKVPKTLSEDRCTIEMNGTFTVKHGNFTATLPTRNRTP